MAGHQCPNSCPWVGGAHASPHRVQAAVLPANVPTVRLGPRDHHGASRAEASRSAAECALRLVGASRQVNWRAEGASVHAWRAGHRCDVRAETVQYLRFARSLHLSYLVRSTAAGSDARPHGILATRHSSGGRSINRVIGSAATRLAHHHARSSRGDVPHPSLARHPVRGRQPLAGGLADRHSHHSDRGLAVTERAKRSESSDAVAQSPWHRSGQPELATPDGARTRPRVQVAQLQAR